MFSREPTGKSPFTSTAGEERLRSNDARVYVRAGKTDEPHSPDSQNWKTLVLFRSLQPAAGTKPVFRVLFSLRQGLIASLGWPRTHYLGPVELKLTEIRPLLPPEFWN